MSSSASSQQRERGEEDTQPFSERAQPGTYTHPSPHSALEERGHTSQQMSAKQTSATCLGQGRRGPDAERQLVSLPLGSTAVSYCCCCPFGWVSQPVFAGCSLGRRSPWKGRIKTENDAAAWAAGEIRGELREERVKERYRDARCPLHQKIPQPQSPQDFTPGP